MNLFKNKWIYNSVQQQKLWPILKRFKSKEISNCVRTLNHFDDFYKAIFGEKWPSVRLGLLSKQKHFAVINNFGEVEKTEEMLKNLGAVDLRAFFEVQKNYVEESNTESPSNENESSLGRIILDKLQKEEEKKSQWLHSEGMEFVRNGEDFNEENGEEKCAEEYNYNINEASSSLAADLKEAEIDSSRLIMPDLSKMGINFSEFLPATKLRGVDHFIPESEYYKYYKIKHQKSITFEEEFELDFPENLKVYSFDRGEVRDFPTPKKCVNGVYNYLKLDGADLLVALALGVQEADTVLDMCSTSEKISYCIFQSLRPKMLICTNDKKYKILDLFSEHLFKDSPHWEEMLFVTSNTANEIENDSLFDKVLVDVPSTFDKTSLFEVEDNIFHPLKISNRLQLPKLQCSLLVKGLNLVRPGGTVIYTTSTLSPIQNDGVVSEALNTIWVDHKVKCTVKNLSPALKHTSLFFNYGDYLNLKFGTLIVPFLPSNFGPRYICKIIKNEQKEESVPNKVSDKVVL